MIGVFIKKRNIDTETDIHRGKTMWRHTGRLGGDDGGCICKPRNARAYQKLGEKPGTESFLEPSEKA